MTGVCLTLSLAVSPVLLSLSLARLGFAGHALPVWLVIRVTTLAPGIGNGGGKQGRGNQNSLRWHVCRVNFARKIFSSHEFSYEKCSEIFPEIFEPLFCGSEKSPENSLQISHSIFHISLRKIKKKSPTSFCRSAGRKIQYRPQKPHGPAKPSRILSKRKADTEFQYRPHSVDTDIDCGRHFCGRHFRDSYCSSFVRP